MVILEKKDRKRRLNKDDIGKPTEFRHITKVRFDSYRGLDVNTSDEMYKEIFKKVYLLVNTAADIFNSMSFRFILGWY